MPLVIVIPIVWMRKLRLRERKWLAQVTDRKRQGETLAPMTMSSTPPGPSPPDFVGLGPQAHPPAPSVVKEASHPFGLIPVPSTQP